MDQSERIIAEQREQLMQLRAENKRLMSAEGSNPRYTRSALGLVIGTFLPKPTGTTIGMKVDSQTRSRLAVQQERLGAKSYRQTVQACVELGLRVMEEVKNDNDNEPDSVASVSNVRRSDDQRDRTILARQN
jgi:hypothetical protein